MAIYDNLPVFKDTYDLLLLFINQSKNIQRDLKYTIAQELKKELMDLSVSIYQANAAVEKDDFISEAHKKIVVIKLNFRLLHDTHQLSTKQFAMFADKTESISKQTFIADSYSCRKGKGTLYGVKRLEHHVRSCSRDYTDTAYALKMDIQGYFMNIKRQRLLDIVREDLLKYAGRKSDTGERWGEKLDYGLLFFLLEEIILTDPTKNCIIKGKKSDWEGLPDNKSLFKTPPDCGLPIGNLTSQLFSNIYLNRLDQLVKRQLREKHYGRYVDDSYS